MDYSLIKDFITPLLTIIGLYIAGEGLSTWHRQIRGSKDFNIAYDLNYAILELREAIKHVRHPAVWPSETLAAVEYAREKYPTANDEEIRENKHSYVYEKRWEKITEALLKVEARLLAAEVLWGDEILSLVKPLKQKVTELSIALQQYFQPELRPQGRGFMDIHKIIYGQIDEGDEFSQSIKGYMLEIHNYLKGNLN